MLFEFCNFNWRDKQKALIYTSISEMMSMKFFYGLGAYLGNKVEQENDVDPIHCQRPNKQTATKIGKHSFVEKNISTYKSGGYLTLQASLINWAAKI